MAKWYRLAAGLAVAGAFVLGIRACQLPNPLQPRASDTNGEEAITESGLTLRDVTLEQPDENGELLWKVEGEEVTYSPDRQIAYVTAPDGELYQDGELIYRVQADTGEIRENGKVIFLRGNIVATGVESQAVLRGNQLEWIPDEDRLIVSKGITGSHPQIRARAQRAEVFNREKKILLQENVVATTVVSDPAIDPRLKLQTEQLVWFWQEESLETERSLRVEQFEGDRVTDFVTGDRGQFDLATLEADLRQNVKMQLLEFPLQITSDAVLWRVEQEQVEVNQPVQIVQPEDKVVVTAQSGRFDLATEQAYLTQNVYARAEQNQAELTSDRLRWQLDQQVITAEGDVRYRQVDPELRLRGNRAVGQLQEQNIVVSGGPVVTEIVPETAP